MLIPAQAAPAKQHSVPPRQIAPERPGLTLPHLKNGPGIVVCEPAVPPGSAEAAFASGCGRWLQFTVGGHGELGQTPRWAELRQAEKEMGRSDLRLTAAQITPLAAATGATRVALGTLTGTATHLRLTYQLDTVTPRLGLGAPIVVSGSPDQIAAELPTVAHQILSRLDFPALPVPASVGATAADLALLGPVVPHTEYTFSDPISQPLLALAARLPLAALIALQSQPSHDDLAHAQMLRGLLASCPENVLALGELSRMSPWPRGLPDALIHAQAQFPNNYVLCDAALEVSLHSLDRSGSLPAPTTTSERAALRRAAAHIVLCAPRNPDAWLAVTKFADYASNSLRRGRTVDQLTEAEGNTLDALGRLGYQSDRAALHLDPNSVRAWNRLAQDATLIGDRHTAETAFYKGVKLDKADVRVYLWGMEMFHPKWGGNAASLQHAADLAAKAPYSPGDAFPVALSLSRYGFQSLASRLLDSVTRKCRAALAVHPDDPQAHMNLALVDQVQGHTSAAVTEYQKFTSLLPNVAKGHLLLANLDAARNDTADAIAQYREAVRLQPDNALVRLQYGQMLAQSDHSDKSGQAAQALRTALQLNPTFAEAHKSLSLIATFQNNAQEAGTEALAALAGGQTDENTYSAAVFYLKTQGRYAAMETLADQAWQAHIGASGIYGEAGAGAMALQDYPKAVQFFREENQLLPPEAGSGDQEQLGEALYRTGQKDEARKIWQAAVADPKPFDPQAVSRTAGMLDMTASLLSLEPPPPPQAAAPRPRRAGALFSNAIALFNADPQDKTGQCESTLRQAIAADPAMATAHDCLAHLLNNQGRYAAAVPEGLEAVSLDPGDEPAYDDAEMALFDTQHDEALIELAEQAITHHITDWSFFDDAAASAMRAKDYPAAVQFYTLLFQYIPPASHSGAEREQMGEALLAVGRKADARKCWQAVVDNPQSQSQDVQQARRMLQENP